MANEESNPICHLYFSPSICSNTEFLNSGRFLCINDHTHSVNSLIIVPSPCISFWKLHLWCFCFAVMCDSLSSLAIDKKYRSFYSMVWQNSGKEHATGRRNTKYFRKVSEKLRQIYYWAALEWMHCTETKTWAWQKQVALMSRILFLICIKTAWIARKMVAENSSFYL